MSSAAQSIPQAVHQTTTSYLLELPAGLRNQIYTLAFSPDFHVHEEVNLLLVPPPDKALLHSCLQVYSDARLLYRRAYQNFWRTSNFVLDITGQHTLALARFAAMDAANINQIGRLRVIEDEYDFIMLDKRGAWFYTNYVNIVGIGFFGYNARRRFRYRLELTRHDMEHRCRTSFPGVPFRKLVLKAFA
ncbi:hypothetical protein DOTSEDRAFT_26395 [Dothistroma septosporum NZE10]|uniref:F-box domain-containing protein n=1 Tax=Dothistroma septosporum (strain NZE10 / CBS 128990) TaxID=675120 RepID=N1PIS5_DOTSN|nr:hypothetical protein DOTSEDRAFT_26395 [Dothistroma septosporum NZE10]